MNQTQTILTTNQRHLYNFEQHASGHYSRNSLVCMKIDLRHFIDYLDQTKLVTDVTFEDLVAYTQYKAEQKSDDGEPLYKQSTLNRNRASLVSFYSYLVEEGLVEQNPATDLKSVTLYKKGQPKPLEYLTPDEARDLLKTIRKAEEIKPFNRVRDIVLFRLMLSTGICVHEIAQLTLEDVDQEAHLVSITNREGIVRQVPYPKSMDEDIEAYLKERDNLCLDSPLFLVSHRNTPITIQVGNAALKKYATLMGLGRKISNIALRHTYAIQLIQLGAPLEEVSQLLGNATLQYTTQTYGQFIQEIPAPYVERLSF